MENMVDKDYRDVSYFVYKIDNTAEERINIKEGDILKGKYKVLSLEDNQNNGMQAMAVAPVNDRGEVDTSKIEHEFQTIDGVGSSIFFDKKYDIIIKNRRRNNEKSHKNRVNYNGNIVCDARCNALV